MKEKKLSRANFINNALYEFRGGMARRFYYTNEEYPYIPYYYNPEDDCLHADAVSVPFSYKEEDITDEVIWDTLVLLENSLKDYFFRQKGITLYEYDWSIKSLNWNDNRRDVLLILYNDPWFSPSGSVKKKTIIDEKGKTIEVPESYYRKIRGGEQILIRVSNHGTSLNTWVKRKADPSKSLQNLTVVFSNEPVSSKSVIEPIEIEDTDGKYAYYNILRLI